MDTGRNAYGILQTIGNFGASVGSNSVSIGSCIVSISTNLSGTTTGPLDAGPAITLSGPNGTSVTLNPSPATFYTAANPFPADFLPVGGGTFVFDNGSGGRDVGHFNAQVYFPALSFTWTNQAEIATVARTQGTTVSWSSGSGDSYVLIAGSASVLSPVNPGQLVGASFNCQAPLSAGSFAVPPWVTLSMPAGQVVMSVELVSKPVPFTAPGLDFGYARGLIIDAKPVNFH